ncbi:HPF/RaiA family ribosome-associated protein [Candidatus Woesebacteria bacterium]|nr:HPF/RaiA family ribosome-associated protein [Candidatus Woesebacteria bacterium]
MQININPKDLKISEKQELFIFRKFKSLTKILKRFDPDEKTVDIRVVEGSRWGYKISFSMWLPRKKHIFAKVKGKNFEDAVNELKQIVIRQVRQYKEELTRKEVEKEKLLDSLK